MKGVHKPFSHATYSKYDQPAKDIILHNLRLLHCDDLSWAFEVNGDKYGPDIVVSRNGEPTGFIEAEIKANWGNCDKFPFTTVNVLERKGKFFKSNAELWLLNITMNRALVIRPESIKEERLVEIPNKYCHSGEMFYQVPIDEATLIRLETLF